MNVTIWHRTGDSMFTERPITKADEFVAAYTYERGGIDEAPSIWRENNRVDGWEKPDEFGTRSLSVGDIIETDEPVALGAGEPDRVWQVARVGFTRVPLGTAFTRLWRIRSRTAGAWRFDA